MPWQHKARKGGKVHREQNIGNPATPFQKKCIRDDASRHHQRETAGIKSRDFTLGPGYEESQCTETDLAGRMSAAAMILSPVNICVYGPSGHGSRIRSRRCIGAQANQNASPRP
jgi:hypothetical protein